MQPPNRVENSVTSKSVIGPMPLTPSTTLRQAVAMSLPTGEMIPMPVTTTRRFDISILDRERDEGLPGWHPGAWAAPVRQALFCRAVM